MKSYIKGHGITSTANYTDRKVSGHCPDIFRAWP